MTKLIHLNEYDSKNRGRLITDLEDLGINPKLLGWWVLESDNGNNNWYVIYNYTEADAVVAFLKYIDIELSDTELADYEELSFNDLDELISAHTYNHYSTGGERQDVTIDATEMQQLKGRVNKPMVKIMDNVSPNNVKYLYDMGKKYFSDFDAKMKY